MDMTDIWIKYKKAIILIAANLAGLVVIVFFYFLVMRVASGPVPKPEMAPSKEVVDFIASPRFKIQSDSFKLEYSRQLMEYCNTPTRIEQFAQDIGNLPPAQADQLRENGFDVVKIQVMDAATQYARLRDSQSRKSFLKSQYGQAAVFHAMITGRGGSGGVSNNSSQRNMGGGGGRRTNIAASPNLTKGMPADSAGMYKMFVQQTSPGERAKMETYVQDMKAYAEQAKAQGLK